MKKISSNWIIVILYAFIGTVCVPNILSVAGDSIWYTNSFFACFFFAINLFVVKRIYPYYKEEIKRKKIYAILFSLCLSTALHFGASLEADGYVTFTDIWLWISILLFGLYLALFIHIGWEQLPIIATKIVEKQKTAEDITENVTKKTTIKQLCQKVLDTPWMTWVSLFILWLPTFLAFFPGAFVYDAQDEYVQVAARTFTTHHPLLHELLLGVPIRAAEHFGLHANVGIACYTLFQMILLSGIFTYFLFLLKKWNANRIYRGITLLIIGLFPIYPMYAVCSAKDTLFTGCLFIVILTLLDYIKSNEEDKSDKKRLFLFIVASVGMMLLRNNGVYAYILLIPVLALIGRKRWKKAALLMVASIILFLACSTVLKIGLHATDEEHQELLTVPIQQLARTYQYAPEAFSPEEKKTLFEVLSPGALDTYSPKISDILKSQFDNEAYALDKGKYLSLWVKTGIKKPFVYINAWFLTSYGYWYPDAILNSYGGTQRFTFQYENSSYFGFETEPPGERYSLFPALEEWYRNISVELFQQKVPVVSMLFSPGFMFWIFAFFWTYLLRYRRKCMLAVLSVIILLWLTVILGPTTLVRYVLILWFIMPVLPITISIGENNAFGIVKK